MGCNFGTGRLGQMAGQPFSILYRIEWVVTWIHTQEYKDLLESFSILYRIEWVVTLVYCRYRGARVRAFSILYRIE